MNRMRKGHERHVCGARPVLITTALIMLLVLAQPAAAHKITIWATVTAEGLIRGEVFAPGAKLGQTKVQVLDSSGRPVAVVITDDNGQFAYRPLKQQQLVLVVDLGDGHVVRKTIEAQQLSAMAAAEPETGQAELANSAGMANADEPPGSQPSAAAPRGSAQDEGQAETPGTNAVLMAKVEALGRQIFALQAQITAAEERVGLRDVAGGVGYIVGAAGLVALIKRRSTGGVR